MSELGQLILKLCNEAISKGYILREEGYGTHGKEGIYKTHNKSIYPLALLVLGRPCTSQYLLTDLKLQGVTLEYYEGFVAGWENQPNIYGNEDGFEDGTKLRGLFIDD